MLKKHILNSECFKGTIFIKTFTFKCFWFKYSSQYQFFKNKFGYALLVLKLFVELWTIYIFHDINLICNKNIFLYFTSWKTFLSKFLCIKLNLSIIICIHYESNNFFCKFDLKFNHTFDFFSIFRPLYHKSYINECVKRKYFVMLVVWNNHYTIHLTRSCETYMNYINLHSSSVWKDIHYHLSHYEFSKWFKFTGDTALFKKNHTKFHLIRTKYFLSVIVHSKHNYIKQIFSKSRIMSDTSASLFIKNYANIHLLLCQKQCFKFNKYLI